MYIDQRTGDCGFGFDVVDIVQHQGDTFLKLEDMLEDMLEELYGEDLRG